MSAQKDFIKQAVEVTASKPDPLDALLEHTDSNLFISLGHRRVTAAKAGIGIIVDESLVVAIYERDVRR